MFAEKQKLVADLEAYGAGHGGGAAPAPAAPAEAPAGLAFNVLADQCYKSVILISQGSQQLLLLS